MQKIRIKQLILQFHRLNGSHGKGAIMRFSSEDILPVEVIPTRVRSHLDIAPGVSAVCLVDEL